MSEAKKVVGAENLVQYAFNKFNKSGKDEMETVKMTPGLYREIREARDAYLEKANEIPKPIDRTPIDTADDKRDEIYR